MTVFCCGGLLRDVGLTFVGPQAEAYFRQINAHTCFLSATGITTSEGVTDPNLLEIQVKRAMAESAARVVLLMDSTKFGVRSLAKIFDIRDFDVLITDADAPAGMLEAIRTLEVDVHLVGVRGREGEVADTFTPHLHLLRRRQRPSRCPR